MNPILLFSSFICRSPGARRLPWRMAVAAVVLGSLTLGLNSCATARGFGRDVETAGEAIEDAASR
jgi:predicted small secreted protein